MAIMIRRIGTDLYWSGESWGNRENAKHYEPTDCDRPPSRYTGQRNSEFVERPPGPRPPEPPSLYGEDIKPEIGGHYWVVVSNKVPVWNIGWWDGESWYVISDEKSHPKVEIMGGFIPNPYVL